MPDPEFRRQVIALFGASDNLAWNDDVWQTLEPALRADVALMENCQLEAGAPLDIPVTLLGGRDDAFVSPEDLLAWGRFTTGDLARRIFPGGHMYFQGAEAELFKTIREHLSQCAASRPIVHEVAQVNSRA